MVQPRNKLTSAGVLAAAFGAALFLLVFPAGERVRYIATVRDGEVSSLPNAMRHLCWIQKGQQALDEALLGLPPRRRSIVLAEAERQGCLEQLSPRNQAAYYILDTEGDAVIERAIGFQRAAIEPAFEALSSNDSELRARGAFVVAALARQLSDTQRERALDILETLEPGPSRRLLAVQLGVQLGVDFAPETSKQVETSDQPAMERETVDTPEEPLIEVPARLEEPELRLPRGGVLFRRDSEPKPEQEIETGAERPGSAQEEPAPDAEPTSDGNPAAEPDGETPAEPTEAESPAADEPQKESARQPARSDTTSDPQPQPRSEAHSDEGEPSRDGGTEAVRKPEASEEEGQ
jgi:hypothetical protein